MAKTVTSANRVWQVLLLLLAAAGISQQATLREASEDFYTAAVVEFSQADGADLTANLADNLAGYLELINSPNATAADIMVFPEMTLNTMNSITYVPAPEKKATPCLDDPSAEYYDPFFVEISCAARNVKRYIVININEKQLCSDTPEDTRPCASNGHNIFNTNVVFDRNGTVVSRYRKVHLYLNEPRNTTVVPEVETFETDFNVTFGHFICFDIAFYVPTLELVEKHGIRDFVYTIKWHSQLPFFTALQVQLGWAYANDVNLLAAGASRLEYGSTGSGIYNGRKGTLTSVIKLDEGERRIYVAQVPKYKKTEPQRQHRIARQVQKRVREPTPEQKTQTTSSGFVMTRDYLEQYKTLWLDQSLAGSMKADVCHGKLCCHFELEWNPLETEAGDESSFGYRLAAYDGWRNQPNVDPNYVRNCGIFACSGVSIDDCGYMLSAEQFRLNLSRILIEAKYPKSQEILLMPNSVRDNLMPLEPAQFEWSVQEEEKSHLLSARFALAKTEALSNLLAFAIFGNYYDEVCTYGTGTPEKDIQCGYKPTDDGAAELRFFASWLHLLLAVGFVYYLRN
ncbi:vanin-like protein 1 [Drosophila hydei]|uniref:Vanin-like protein 1 n=1 Tax=Drosophila hydei TaxID=7224 RepID=A0A6J1M864_DROHY|nr:vanin-like protein 1 [Drosophila hydei]